MRRLGRGALLALCAVVLTAGGCGDSDDAPDWDPLPKVEHAAPDAPRDRDVRAVWASLGRVDACALLDAGAAGLSGYEPEPTARSPHDCRIERTREASEVTVTLGTELSSDDRYAQARESLGRYAAYVDREQAGGTMCGVSLPVSQLHAIQFTAGGMDGGDCHDALAFAKAAATRLAGQPETVAHPPGADQRVACDLLSSATGPIPDERVMRTGDGFLESIDSCGIWETSVGKLGTGAQLQPSAPVTSLEFDYSSPIREYFGEGGYTGQYRQLGGTEVYVLDQPSCEIAWDAWSAPASGADAGEVALARVTAPTCPKAERIATGVMTALAAPPPSRSPIPTLPMTFDEKDTDAPGACEDLQSQATYECAPYVDVEVPEDPVDLIRHVEADTNVGCAASLDAVESVFGSRLQPVTATGLGPVETDADGDVVPVRDCVFVEPGHELQVLVRFSAAPMEQFTTTDTEVSGHPAGEPDPGLSPATPGALSAMTVALGEPSERGQLYVKVTVLPARGTGMHSDSPVDKEPLRRLDDLVEQLTEERLG